MLELIEKINDNTGRKVVLYYYSDNVKEGYRAAFYRDDPTLDYVMEELYASPMSAIERLAKEYEID